MQNILYYKKTVFTFGLIVVAMLMIIFTFAVPGKRSYVGREDVIKEAKIKEPEEKIETATMADRNNNASEKYAEDIYPVFVNEEMDALPKVFTEETTKEAVWETAKNEPDKNTEKIPQDKIKTISHDHVKLNAGYHMIGEPNKKEEL